MKRTVGAALLLLLINSLVSASAPTIATVSFRIAGSSDRTTELLDVAHQLVALREGEPMDSVALRESLDAMRRCGLFETVGVAAENGRVTFLLVPARYVRDIRIWQEYPLFEDDVEKVLSTYPGDIFREDALVVQDSLVTAFYRREGFIDPQVAVTATAYKGKTDRVIELRVQPGTFYRLKTIEFRGNRAVSRVPLLRRMKSWQASLVPGSAGRFADAVFRDDLASLAEFYKVRGFPNVAIHDTLVGDSVARTVRAVVSIDEGNRYRIIFPRKRIPGLNREMVKKDIVLRSAVDGRFAGMQRSIASITRQLNAMGFPDAQVTASDTLLLRRQFTERLVRFSVVRGRRIPVSSITIEGAAGLDEHTVRRLLTHVDKGNVLRRSYAPERLQEDVFAVRMLYRSNGFLGAAVDAKVNRRGDSAAITLLIKEGPRTVIRGVSVDVTRFPPIDAGSVITVKPGDPFRSDRVKRDAQMLQMMVAGRGFPHAAVDPVVTMARDSCCADVDFRIKEGPLVTLGGITYVGLFRTRERVLGREFTTLPGKPLSLKDIVDAQKGVRDIGLFSSVRFRTIGLREKRDTVRVFVEVAEKRSYFGSVGGGYQSDKGPFAQGKVGDRNVGGLNKELWVGGEVSQIGYRGKTGLLDPGFLGTRLRALIEVFGEKTTELHLDWWSTAYGVSTGITATPVKRLTLSLGNNYERRRLSFDNAPERADTSAMPDSLQPRNIIVLKPSFLWDRRDSFTRPHKGVYIGASVTLSKSVATTLDDFVKVQLDMKGFFTPMPPLTLAGTVRCGYLRPFGSASTVPADQRFYLGGTGDVRGFAENRFHQTAAGVPVGSTVSITASFEVRIAVGTNFELPLFADAGRLEDAVTIRSPEEFRASAGGGIRYITPIGPIGILYGRKLRRFSGEAPGAFHFSLGYTF